VGPPLQADRAAYDNGDGRGLTDARNVAGTSLAAHNLDMIPFGSCVPVTSPEVLRRLLAYLGVRFQKELRPVSLEIPEPDATAYQNLMRQNPI
jgi:hypothetical protein